MGKPTTQTTGSAHCPQCPAPRIGCCDLWAAQELYAVGQREVEQVHRRSHVVLTELRKLEASFAELSYEPEKGPTTSPIVLAATEWLSSVRKVIRGLEGDDVRG